MIPPHSPAIFGTHDEKTLAQLRDVASRAERAALMADGHVGYVMPIGGVAAYRDKVSVAGVGFDIACGNAAIRTDRSITEYSREDFCRADETGAIWVGVHFGSRGFGHTTASGFLALSRGRTWRERVPEAEVLLDLKSPLGDAYWSLMNLAGQ